MLKANCSNLEDSAEDSELFNQCESIDQEHAFFQGIKKDHLLRQWRSTGVFEFNFDVPENAEKIQIYAMFSHENIGSAETSATAYATYSPRSKPCSDMNGPQYFLQVHTSTKEVRIGEHVVLHVKTNFPFASFDWLIFSKDIILNNGREIGNNIHPEVMDTYVKSCAGYCVVTYLLGVGDRHLDNLLLTKVRSIFTSC